MKATNEKVYRCDHCNRPMVSAGFMKVHERMCKKNSNNQHQCFKYCEHLTKDVNGESGEIFFTCNKTGNDMYSYKLERFKDKLNRRLKNNTMTRMPLDCDLYSAMKGHDFSENEPDLENYQFYPLEIH